MMIQSDFTLSAAMQERGDFDRGLGRIDPADLKRLGLLPGARIAVRGARTIYIQAQPAAMEHRNQGVILLDDLQLQNCGVRPGDKVQIAPAPELKPLDRLVLTAPTLLDARAGMARLERIKRQIDGMVAGFGDWLRVRMPDQYDLIFQVESTPDHAPGIVKNLTDITIAAFASAPPLLNRLAGLRREFLWLEERIRPPPGAAFAAPRGIILQGTPGAGKNTLVRAVAEHIGASFDRISADAIVADAASARLLLQQSFTAATTGLSPAVILIDDIDLLLADTPEWHRITLASQLYTQMDQAPRNASLTIVGIMHRDAALDPAAGRPGRFERVLAIDPPDRENRLEILQCLARDIPCTGQVDLKRLAAVTGGYAAADLAVMLQEAMLKAQRDVLHRPGAAPAPVAMHHVRAAMTETVPSRTIAPVAEIPALTWHDIAGLDDIKLTLREAVERPVNFNHDRDDVAEGALPPRGILVTGAPGTGKTSIVKALAGATHARFMHIDCGDLALSDAPCAALHKLFAQARRLAPSIVFFDNLDRIIPVAGEAPHEKIHAAFNAFLREFDATAALAGLVVLAATSHADRVDQTLMRPGRFDYVVNVPLPDPAARQKIFAYHAHKLPLAADIDFEELARATQGFSGADIEGVCRRAGLFALRQSIGRDDGPAALPVVTMAIFEQLLRGWHR